MLKHIVAGSVAVLFLFLIFFSNTYPHHLVFEKTLDGAEQISEPLLDCNYVPPLDPWGLEPEPVLVKKWFSTCEVLDVPKNAPYLKLSNPYLYFLYKYQALVGLFMILVAVLLIFKQKALK